MEKVHILRLVIFKQLLTIGHKASRSKKSGSNSGTNAIGGPGMFGNQDMQSIMQKMAHNSEIMQEVLNSPQAQEMLQSLSENPDIAASMIGNMPDQLKNMMPTLMQKLQKVSKNIEKHTSCC